MIWMSNITKAAPGIPASCSPESLFESWLFQNYLNGDVCRTLGRCPNTLFL